MAALFWNQAWGYGQNTTSYKFQVPVITSGLYLLSKPCYSDGNFLQIFFFNILFFCDFLLPLKGLTSVSTPLFLLLELRSQKKMSPESEMSQWSFCFCFDLPVLIAPPRLWKWVVYLAALQYLTILTKYWVSVTRLSCWDRSTLRALAPQTLIQQRIALSGGNLPQAGRQRGTFKEPGRLTSVIFFFFFWEGAGGGAEIWVHNYSTIATEISQSGGKPAQAGSLVPLSAQISKYD